MAKYFMEQKQICRGVVRGNSEEVIERNRG